MPSSLLVALIALALVAAWAILTYNRLRALLNACDAAWSLVDVQLQRRADLVPNLVAIVEAYAAHERAVLEAVSAARRVVDPQHAPSPEHARAEARLGTAIGDVVALQQAYPQLAASEQFMKLQATLTHLEDQIEASREIYNGNTVRYLDLTQQVPSSFIARWRAFPDREMFVLEGARGPSR